MLIALARRGAVQHRWMSPLVLLEVSINWLAFSIEILTRALGTSKVSTQRLSYCYGLHGHKRYR